jgi:hypothetical protein
LIPRSLTNLYYKRTPEEWFPLQWCSFILFQYQHCPQTHLRFTLQQFVQIQIALIIEEKGCALLTFQLNFREKQRTSHSIAQ